MHQITSRDGVFAVREPMWHGLGEVLPEYPTRDQAQKIAHPWEPVSEPLYRKVPHVIETPGGMDVTETYEQVDTHQALVRSDDGYTVGVVTKTFTPVLNGEMYDIAEAIEGEDKGSVRYETGGSLKGGSKVWLLLRLDEPIQVKGDPHGETIPYYALQNSHDGTAAFRGQGLMTRIVCDNTAQMADLEAENRGTTVLFRHTKNVAERIALAREALAGWRAGVQAYRLMADHLSGRFVDSSQAVRFAELFIPMPPPHVSSSLVQHNVHTARRQLLRILGGPTCEGLTHNAYGLVQASVEYLNHHRKARSNESRFQRAYLSRNTIVTDAVTLALEVSNA